MNAKNILLLLFLLISSYCHAQFEVSTEGFYAIKSNKGFDASTANSFGINVIGAYRFHLLRMGIGTGVTFIHLHADDLAQKYKKEIKEYPAYLPVYGHLKFNVRKRGMSPYVLLNAGWTFSITKHYGSAGYMVMPAVGIDFPLRFGNVLYGQVGFITQKVVAARIYKIEPFSSPHARLYKYDRTLHQFALSLGYTFSL